MATAPDNGTSTLARDQHDSTSSARGRHSPPTEAQETSAEFYDDRLTRLLALGFEKVCKAIVLFVDTSQISVDRRLPMTHSIF